MALELYIPPCGNTPANSLHLPSPEQPVRIQVEGQVETLQELLPEISLPTSLGITIFPRPGGLELARLAFQKIYGREADPDVAGDLVVRDEYLGWEMNGKTRELRDYGVTFDHLVPANDPSPKILQILIIEVNTSRVTYLKEHLSCVIDSIQFVGINTFLAVPRCCRKAPGSQDCEWVNRSVAERDRGVLKQKEISSSIMDDIKRAAQFDRRNEVAAREGTSSNSNQEIEDLHLERLQIDNFSKYTAERAKLLNDASKEKFQYGEPLPKGNIRLLQLHPGSGDDPLVCSLILGSLESMPFEAVSYVWGSEDNPHSITCNWATPIINHQGFSVSCPEEITNNMTVTENLYRLLLRLRNPAALRVLWIDQICIDQDKNPSRLKEKMDQVRNMAEVYSAASNVVIWLGEEDNETASAFGMMNWLATTMELPEDQILPMIMYLLSTDDFSQNEADDPVHHARMMENLKSLLIHIQPRFITGLEDPNRVHMTLLGNVALSNLLQRPWFHRTWTFQETISARRATIVCGSHDADWDTLYRACKCMQARRIKTDGVNNRVNIAHVVESTVKKGDLQHDWARMKRMTSGLWTNRPPPQDHTWNNSGDPRDKVLALLGIAHDDNRWIEFPDYKWPVVNLYTSIVSYWVRGVEKMDISFLNHVQDSNPEHKLPSWTPDWSTPTVATPLIEVAEFSASGDTVPTVFMDRVDYLGELDPFPYFPPMAIEGYFILKVQVVEPDLGNLESHVEMINQFQDPYPRTRLPYPEAYQKIVYHNIPDDFSPLETVEGAPSFWEYTNNYNKVENGPATSPSTSSSSDFKAPSSSTTSPNRTTSDLKSLITDPSILTNANSDFQYHTRTSVHGRAFFTSTTGFMGLCPRNTMPGDKIFILLGGATPFVIRGADAADGIVRLVGECLVLGLMHGETLEGRPKQKTLIVLR